MAREFWGHDICSVILKIPECQILFDAGESAKLPTEGAKPGHDIPRGSAMDRAYMDGGCRRIEAPRRIAACRELPAKAIEFGDELASRLDGARAETWLRGMRLMAMHSRRVSRHAFVRVRHLHCSGLADDHGAGARQIGPEPRDRVERAAAGGFFVIAQENMDRRGHARLLEFRNHGKTDCVETLHVAGAAAINAVRLAAQFKRITRPGLAFHGDHIGVSRQDDPAIAVWADAREKCRLVAGGIRDSHIGYSRG